MLEKAYKYSLTILLLLSPIFTYRPFSIHAYDGMPIVGYNVRIIDYDYEQQVSNSTQTGTFTTVGSSNNAISMGEGTLSNGAKFYSTGLSGGGIRLNGTISINNSGSYSNIFRRVIQTEIILDNDYIGYVNITYTSSQNGGYNHTSSVNVNGSVVIDSFVDTGDWLTASYDMSVQYFLVQNNNHERWTFPLESYPLVLSAFNNNLQLYGINQYNSYYLPIFKLKKNDVIHTSYATASYVNRLIMVTSDNVSVENINTFFSLNNGLFTNYKYIGQFLYGSSFGRIFSVDITYTSSGGKSITYIGDNDMFYIPIYFNTVNNKYVSTDFALQFGLTNELLDNLNIIANGTSNSNTSSDNLDNSNSSVSTVVDEYDSIESNFNDSLNSSLNDIDTSLTPSSMGSKFQTSAIWVRTQFNRMTNNTPFGSIMGFSLLLGLSLLIIGKINR